MVATFFISAIFLVALCCDACRAVGASGVDFRFCGRSCVLVEEFESLKVSRILKQEVTIFAILSAHTIGGFGVDERAIGVVGFLIEVTPVGVVIPLSNRVVAVICDLTSPTGPNLTCPHIPDIAYHVAVVDLVVNKVEALISLFVEGFKFLFPFNTGFAHIIALSILHGNEGHLVG